MIVTLIVAGEIGFWVLLALALAVRYGLRLRALSTVLLLGLPLVDLAVLALTTVDLSRGATADWAHGLAASYVGFSVAFGHSLVRWADGHAAHRLAGAPAPPPAPKYGPERTRREWVFFGRTAVGAAITCGLIAGVTRLVDDGARTAGLDSWYGRMGLVCGINLLIALSYTIWPKEAPEPPPAR